MSRKMRLVEALVADLQREIETGKKGFENAKRSAHEAEGRMITRYDSTKEEAGKLASAFSARVAQAQQLLKTISLQKLDDNLGPTDPIRVGSLVTFIEGEKPQEVLIVPGGAGRGLMVDGQDTMLISPESPMGRALIGHRVGKTVVLPLHPKRRELVIVSHT